MIVLSGALVLVALVLLVFGAVDRNLPYVYASIGVSVLSLLLLVVGVLQRRGELSDDEQGDATTAVTDGPADRAPSSVEHDRGQAPAVQSDHELVVPVAEPAPAAEERPASRRVVPVAAPVEQAQDDADRDLDDAEPDDAPQDAALGDEVDEQDVWDDEEDVEDEEGSGVTVLVVSGRPRYHLEGCRVLRGKEPEPLDRDDARTHGFSPCGVCKPDAERPVDGAAADEPVVEEPVLEDEPAGADEPAADEPAADEQQPAAVAVETDDEGGSITEVLFGEPLFADDADGVGTDARPDQPDAEALGTDRRVPEVPAEERASTPVELRGDDPADDPALGSDDVPDVEPAPDVAADPDEPLEEPAGPDEVLPEPTSPAADLDEEPSSAAEPVGAPPELEPVADDVPVQVHAPAAEEPAAAPAVTRTPARKRPSKVGSAGAEQSTSDVAGAPAEVTTGPATKAPAKKAPAKKAPAKRAPAKKAAAQAPAAEAPDAAPQVKRPLVRAVRADALRLGAPSTGVTTTRVSARAAAAPAAAPPVVVVPDRDRFHRPQCRFVREVAGATTLPKASATRQGYAACGACKP